MNHEGDGATGGNDSSHGREGEDGEALSCASDTQSNIGGRLGDDVDRRVDGEDAGRLDNMRRSGDDSSQGNDAVERLNSGKLRLLI